MMRTTGGQASQRLGHDASTVSAHVQLSGSRGRKGPSMRVLAAIGILAILAVISATVFLFRGFYSVAVNEARFSSRQLGAWEKIAKPPSSTMPISPFLQAARAFSQRGCATCHGAPSVESAEVFRRRES